MIPPPPRARASCFPIRSRRFASGPRWPAALESSGREGTRGPRSLYLRGSLGAGKTTLVRGLMRGSRPPGSGPEPRPTRSSSPTSFPASASTTSTCTASPRPGSSTTSAPRDYFHDGALCVVEWPERGGEALPSPDLSIELRILDEGRLLLARGRSARGRGPARGLVSVPFVVRPPLQYLTIQLRSLT